MPSRRPELTQKEGVIAAIMRAHGDLPAGEVLNLKFPRNRVEARSFLHGEGPHMMLPHEISDKERGRARRKRREWRDAARG